uniref:KRAB domain-containing protein n=1 Tax=Pseudonaja textilis TaxID=8673 RepID=A0A670Z242_PSETE
MGLVSFEEVAVCFSKEEWTQLNPHQKALHGEVMRENLRNVKRHFVEPALWPKANHTRGGIQQVLTRGYYLLLCRALPASQDLFLIDKNITWPSWCFMAELRVLVFLGKCFL